MVLLRKIKKQSAQLLSLPAHRLMAAQATLFQKRPKKFAATTVCVAWFIRIF